MSSPQTGQDSFRASPSARQPLPVASYGAPVLRPYTYFFSGRPIAFCSLKALRKIALAPHISADILLFEKEEREPPDDLKIMFEAVGAFDDDDKQMAKKAIQGLIIQNQAKRWSASA